MNDTVNLGKLCDKSALITRSAVALGWIATNSGSGGINIVAPDGTRIAFPPGNLNENQLKSMAKKVFRHGDSVALALFSAYIDHDQLMRMNKNLKPFLNEDPNNPSPYAINGNTIPAKWTPSEEVYKPAGPTWHPVEPKTPTTITAPLVSAPAITPAITPADLALEPEPTPETKPRRRRVQRSGQEELTSATVLTSNPWLARSTTKADKSYLYESATAMERTWSDGVVDYACRKRGCQFTAERGRSVSSHYGHSADHSSAKEPKRGDYIIGKPYEPSHRDPSALAEQRISKLAKELSEALALLGEGSWAPEDLARQIVSQRDAEGRYEREEAGPLSAEDVIERIRRLVDQGKYLEQIEKTQEMELMLAEERAAREKAEAKVATMTRDVGALRELLSNVGAE